MIILRGLSGSGKSTLAQMLADILDAIIYSTDEFFYDKDGNYVFDGEKLREYHAANLTRAQTHLRQTPHIPLIIDNTNTTKWEMQPYIAAARQAGVKVQIVEIEATVEDAFKRCTHSVPLESIENQAARWEPSTGLGVGFTSIKFP